MFQHQPDQLGFDDFLVRVEFPREPDSSNLELPVSILTQHSPVFASMVEGVWRESHERLVTVVAFLARDFEACLRCLALILASQDQDDVTVWIGASLATRVLPVAFYYQIEPVIAFITGSVTRLLASNLPDRVDQATDLVLAIEEGLPDTEHPPWPIEILARINARMIHVLEPSFRLEEVATGEIFYQTTIAHKGNDCLDRLTPRTLRLCILNLSMDLHQTLRLTPRGYTICNPSLKF